MADITHNLHIRERYPAIWLSDIDTTEPASAPARVLATGRESSTRLSACAVRHRAACRCDAFY